METVYIGSSFSFEGTDLRVTRATVTEQQIALDWIQGTEVGGFVARSTDGVVYRGTYGTAALDPDSHVEFRLYRAANGELLLFGDYWREDGSDSGTWLLRLTPTPK